MERIENTILRNLLYNDEYARKTLPFIKEEYFSQFTDKAVFQEIKKYFEKYSNLPTKEAVSIELSDRTDLTEENIINICYLHNTVLVNLIKAKQINSSIWSKWWWWLIHSYENSFCLF